METKHTKKPYPYFGITHKKINTYDGRFTVCRQDAINGSIVDSDDVTGKLLWYTTEGGYDYNHPYSRAKKRAEIIQEALNKTDEQRKIEKAAPDLLEACQSVIEMLGEDWEETTEVNILKAAIKKATE